MMLDLIVAGPRIQTGMHRAEARMRLPRIDEGCALLQASAGGQYGEPVLLAGDLIVDALPSGGRIPMARAGDVVPVLQAYRNVLWRAAAAYLAALPAETEVLLYFH